MSVAVMAPLHQFQEYSQLPPALPSPRAAVKCRPPTRDLPGVVTQECSQELVGDFFLFFLAHIACRDEGD